MQLYINTHDPQDNTRYYQWEYTETWEFHSSYKSILKYKITQPETAYIVLFTGIPLLFPMIRILLIAGSTEISSSIHIGSSAQLSKDIVYLPLVFVPHGSIKLGVLYSINVKQYAWTKEGYEFLERMKKNTESTGSIFDAQPSELKGNIHCVADSSEPVIGYFNICPAQEKRIFIKNSELSLWGYQANCYSIEIKNISDTILTQGLSLMPTIVATETPFGSIATFYAAPPECVDCTLRGSNKNRHTGHDSLWLNNIEKNIHRFNNAEKFIDTAFQIIPVPDRSFCLHVYNCAGAAGKGGFTERPV